MSAATVRKGRRPKACGNRSCATDHVHIRTFKRGGYEATLVLIGAPRRPYLWIGDPEEKHLVFVSGRASLLALADAIQHALKVKR